MKLVLRNNDHSLVIEVRKGGQATVLLDGRTLGPAKGWTKDGNTLEIEMPREVFAGLDVPEEVTGTGALVFDLG